MTRLHVVSALVALGSFAAPLAAQTYVNQAARSAYAPKPAAGGSVAGNGSAPGQPAAQAQRGYGPQPLAQEQPTQAVRQQATPQTRGPQVFGQQPIRQVAGEAPIKPPAPSPNITPAAPVAPQQPEWFPLDAAHQKWVEEILQFWEQKSSKTKTFESKFWRWDYDPAFGPKNDAKTFSEGVIKYAQPDKGLYRVEKLSSYAPPAKEGDKPQYIEQDATYGEHWVCDGKQVFAFDAVNKKVIVSPLPPQVQGRAIVDGPLPFLFGARAQTILARYWIRGLPESGDGKYWLEAVPKSRQDAQNFKMIHIVLNGETFLPEMLQLFAPNYDPRTNPSRTTLMFKDIKTSDEKSLKDKVAGGLDPLGLFHKEFYAPATPKGWQRIVENAGPVAAPPDDPQRQAQRPQGGQARPLPLPK